MIKEFSHRRLNILTGDWILVSPHRAKRPWQGEVEVTANIVIPKYVDDCYLCPGNLRASGERNPEYYSTFSFDNDFSALQKDTPDFSIKDSELLIAKSEKGICRVICFSPRHDLTLAELETDDIVKVIQKWKDEFRLLGSKPEINYVQIFENKGEIMGCSNPHPHGQIWAQHSIPDEPKKEHNNQLKYFKEKKQLLLIDYLNLELQKNERIIYENDSFVLLVPFWAVWPFEVMIIPKKKIQNILEFSDEDVSLFADILKTATVKYDNLFTTSFPYSAGIHQAPTDNEDHPEWQLHMHFLPPLLRSASIKKFMVGYEMLAEPQRDITPEKSAEILKNLSTKHYSLSNEKINE